MSIKTFSINGFTTATQAGRNSFVPPCLYYGYFTLGKTSGDQSKSAAGATEVVYQYAIICGIGDSLHHNSLLNSTIVLYCILKCLLLNVQLVYRSNLLQMCQRKELFWHSSVFQLVLATAD